MSGWVKTHEDWYGEDRIEQLGSHAAMLHLSALAHSSRYLKDGQIPRSALRKLWPVADVDEAIHRLIDAGLWEATEDGYFIRDWKTHILAADEVEHRRDQDRARQQRKRRHDAGDHSMCDRCSYVKAHGKGHDGSHAVTPPVTHGAVTPPEPHRTEPNRTDPKGLGEERESAPPARSARATRAGDAEEAQPPPALPLNSWPDWCKHCDNTTRLKQTEDGKMQRCPDCHPNQVAA